MRRFLLLIFLFPLLPVIALAADDTRVGLLGNQLPYSDFNLWQRPDGAFPELLETLKSQGDLTFSLQRARDVEQLAQMLREHKIAMALPPPLSTPPPGVLVSHPLFQQQWVLITRNNHLPLRHNAVPDLNQQRILLPPNSTVRASLLSSWPEVMIEEGKTLREALKQLNTGAADGIVCDAALADMLIHNLYPGQLSSHLLSNIKNNQVLWIAPGEEGLLQRVNQTIDSLPPGMAASVVTRWLLSAALDDVYPDSDTDSGILDSLVVISGIVSLFLIAFLLSEILRRRRAERGLLDALTYWQTLLNSVPAPLLVCNPLGEITHCNQAFLNSLQLESEQVIGMSLEKLMQRNPITPPVGHQEWITTISTMKPQFTDRTIVIQGSQREIAQWMAVYSDSRQVPQGVLLGWYDISERKRLERELATTSQQAISASQEKSQFLARMSHEIRSPMNAILGVLELEMNKVGAEESALHIAYGASRQLLQIVGDVLDISKIEAGEMQLHAQHCALYPMLEQIIDTYTTLAHQKHLRLDSDVESVWQQNYRVDGTKLAQILNNLLSNAIKYTEQGFVSLQVHREPGENGKDNLTFRVADSGIGIAADKQAKILQPWVQLDPTAPASTGLGLTICNQLLKLMGSSLAIQSTEGQGACFSFSLTLENIPEETMAEPVSSGEQPGRALQLLVVDDQHANLLVMKLQLETLGHQVTLCNDSRQANQLLAEQSFDLVLTDCQMPLMTGYQLASTQREREKGTNRYQVIIGCTANAFNDEQRRCLEAGMDGVLIKPVALEDLRHLIAEQEKIQLCMTEINALAAEQTPVRIAILDELLLSSENDRRQLMALSVEETAQYGAALHSQKGSFALAGFQTGVDLCVQMEKALQVRDTSALNLYQLYLNALSLRFIALLKQQRGGE